MSSASGDRADALGQALQVLIEHDLVDAERFDACDAIDMAEYIRAGKRGVPVEMQLKSPFVTTKTDVHPHVAAKNAGFS